MKKRFDNIDIHDKVFGATEVSAAAGCNPATLRAWRRRNGLFTVEAGNRKPNHFSLFDICLVRAVVQLTDHGLYAQHAIDLVQAGGPNTVIIAGAMTRILEGKSQDEIIGISTSEAPPPDEKIYDADKQRVVTSAEVSASRFTCLVMGEGNVSLADALMNTKGAATFINLKAIVEHVLGAIGLVRSKSS